VAQRLLELWRRRDLVFVLAARDLQLRYKGSMLGLAWSLMHPLVLAAVYLVAFQYFIRIQIPNYALFLLAGLLPWIFFATAIAQAAGSVAAQGHLVRKLAFPRAALPLGSVIAQLVHFAVAYLVVVPALAAWQVGLGPAALALPVLIVLFALFTCGIGLAAAAAQVYLRDTRHLLDVLLQVWFWLTPIVYSLEIAGLERFAAYFALNPLVPFLAAFRLAVMEGRLPGLLHVVGLLLLGGGSFLAGFAVFARAERRFAEYV